MATVITKTVKPSGGDYTLVSTAYGDAPASLVAADEQWDILCDTFSGGVSDGFDTTTKTSDATRFIRIAAAAGHEYNQWDDSGFFMAASRNFDGVITNTTTTFLRLENIGLKNTGTSSARGITSSVDDITISGVYATTAATSQPCFNVSSGERILIEFCVGEGGATCLATGSFTGGDANNLTGIDNTNGYSKGGASRALILTNSLYIGSGAFISGTNNFNAASDYNAGSDTTAPGANSLDNRTTADFADYAGGDYRTASASALATAGDGVTSAFIGFALEAGGGGGITITPTLGAISYSSQSATVSLTGSVDVVTTLGAISYSSQNTSISLTGDIDVTATLGLISYSSQNTSVSLSGEINVNPTLGAITYSSQNTTVSVTGDVDVISTLGAINYTSNNTTVNLSGAINVISTLGSIDYSSQNAVVTLTGLIDVNTTLGSIVYNSYPVIVKVGGGQIIGNVTTGFADDIYTAGFKPDTITVSFK